VLQRIHKEPLIVEAWERVLRANGAIQVEREVDAATAERMNLTEKQKRYFETAGRVAAVEVATQNPGTGLPGHFYGAELKTRVIPYVNALSKSALTNLNPRQRKQRVKEIESIQFTLTAAANCLEKMRAFLAPGNLRELAKLQVSRSNQRTERVLRQFAETPAAAAQHG
jgi:cob(I)alamin adenosyltransferase